MDRITEPELMEDEAQARAYAQADFAEAHSAYPRLFLSEFKSVPDRAVVLDLGCGPGDVTMRFAQTFPHYEFEAVDGSAAMLDQARGLLGQHEGMAAQIRLVQGTLPGVVLPRNTYDIILSSNLLHHLAEPNILWQTIRRYARRDTLIFVTDLFRPPHRKAAEDLMERYAGDEPEVLRRDFFNSLLAAFTPEEIQRQLAAAQLESLAVKVISDRHVIVAGRM